MFVCLFVCNTWQGNKWENKAGAGGTEQSVVKTTSLATAENCGGQVAAPGQVWKNTLHPDGEQLPTE